MTRHKLHKRHLPITVADPGFGGRGGRELSYTRARHEVRSGGRGEEAGCPPFPSGKKIEIRKCLDDF